VASLVALQAAAAEAVRRAVLDGVLAADPATGPDDAPRWADRPR
jgi:L-aminopeptidase/D-esterase-like protein